MIRVLSIDGGGIRGVIPVRILMTLEDILKAKLGRNDIHLSDFFDLIVGTSTGGIIACAYLLDKNYKVYNSKDILDLYFDKKDDIFKSSWGRAIFSVGGITDAKYSHHYFEEVLDEYFGDQMLSNLTKPCLITSYDIERRKAVFFKQHYAHVPGRNFLVKDIIRSTSAAPTYFEPSYIKDDLGEMHALIDGGVFANNPTMCAFAEVKSYFKESADNMCILSLGTGQVEESYMHKKVKRWGKADWIKPVLDVMMSGVSETIDYQVHQIFKSFDKEDHYLRLQPDLTTMPKGSSEKMDDISDENLKGLKLVAEREINYKYDNLVEFANLLIKEYRANFIN